MGFQQGFRINTNTASLNTYRSYSASQAGMEQNIERLSSGLRINKASDDAAGLAISDRMDNQIRGLQQANRNVQQGNNLLQTAEGGLNEIGNILGRMRELAVQSASDTVSGSDRDSIDLEFDQLGAEITRIAKSTEYNGISLLDGSQNTTDDNGKTITLQIGADNSSNDQLDINLGDFTLGTSYDNANFGGVGATGLVYTEPRAWEHQRQAAARERVLVHLLGDLAVELKDGGAHLAVTEVPGRRVGGLVRCRREGERRGDQFKSNL